MNLTPIVSRAVNSILAEPELSFRDAAELHEALSTAEKVLFGLCEQTLVKGTAAGAELERWREQVAIRMGDLVEVVRESKPEDKWDASRRALFLICFEAENRPSLVPTLTSAIRATHQDII